MDENKHDGSSDSVERRKFIAGVGAGVAGGLAGCAGSDDETTTENQPENVSQGGKPVLGMQSQPKALNLFVDTSNIALTLMELLHTKGAIFHPKTYEPIPWAFKDWEVNPENAGSSKPTITAELREGLTFSDGKELTAEDVQFSANYISEHGAGGDAAAAVQFEKVKDVTVDKAKGTTVNYFLKEKEAKWASGILGAYILPKHVWKDISSPDEYTPRNSDKGVVGAGPMTLKDFSWGNWIEFEMRENDAVPWNSLEVADWLHDDGPFIDGVRFEIFGSANAKAQAVLNGDVDLPNRSVTVNSAAEATSKEFLKVLQSNADGYQYHGMNTRRVPLDDVAFRQLLAKLLDRKWVIDNLFQGLGAKKGSYATAKPYKQWRPPEPWGEAKEYKGISLPDLTYPGERGENQMTEEGMKAARDFLIDHPEAKHDYSIGEAATNITTASDKKELYVNGKPLTEAHTDNDGNPGQGPLEITYNPPSDAPLNSRLVSNWIASAKAVGIPIRGLVQSFSAQIDKLWILPNDFDIYEVQNTHIGPLQTHLTRYYSSKGIPKDEPGANIEYYSNADDLILKQDNMMDLEARKPIVKKALAKIYRDAPIFPTYHPMLLQPVNKQYTGWVPTIGGVANAHTWMNLRKSE